MDRFTLGVTTKTEVESELRKLGLVPLDLACSSITGPCDGYGVELANFPESSQHAIAAVQDIILDRISIFRPTYFVANFYFHSDQLAEAGVSFSTDKAAIGMELGSTDLGEEAKVEWRRGNHAGHKTYVRILDPAHQQEASLHSSGLFDLGCMASIRGCNTESELWPSISQYKVNK
jgi:hypothetical protein